MKHTELPWKDDVVNYGDNGSKYHAIVDIGFNEVIGEFGVNKEDAAFIVKACNNHYQLLEALNEMVRRFPADMTDNGNGIAFLPSTRLAVANAKEAIKQAEVE